MLIDWFTVGAQIVNFLILLVLLKVFLYDRIIAAMDQRQQRIQERLAEADEKRDEAEQEASSLQEERAQLQQAREQMMAEAKQAAEEQRRKLEEEARRTVAQQRKSWERQLKKDQQDLIRKLKISVADEVFAVTRNIMQDLADQSLEENIAERFTQRLTQLDDAQREELRKSLQGDEDPAAVVHSAFSIPERRRSQIEAKLKDIAGDSVAVRYETDADLILGIELKAAGKKVAWHAAQYLDRIEERALEAIGSGTGEAETQAETTSAESHADP
jgi:F-type H+-transporting ATPase subunit b